MDGQWDQSFDVVVVGSGAGGMTAALTAKAAGANVVLIEKADKYGGSTVALSGGGIWAPNNPTLLRLGLGDDPEDVRKYLHAVVGDRVPAARLDTYAAAGPLALEFLEKQSPNLRFFWCRGDSDYHPEYPGGRPNGRSIEAKPFDKRKLGPMEADLLQTGMGGPAGLWVTATDFHDLNQVARTWVGKKAFLRAGWRVLSNLVRRRRMATTGSALVGRLRLALSEAGVDVWLSTPVKSIVSDAGRVVGVEVERDGQPLRLEARSGVILATGGFDHDAELRAKYLGPVEQDWSMGAPTNTGDGIRLGEELGAALDLMDDAWWMPAIEQPKGRLFPLVSERSMPGSLIVNQAGRRFTNESAPYVNFIHDQLRAEEEEGGHIPVWFLMDHRARQRYTFAAVAPFQPLPKSWFGIGTLFSSSTLDGLAEKIGVPAAALVETVTKFNAAARTGRDEEFHRGDSAYDRYYGDPTLPNPCLNELVKPPFYAAKLVPGDLGTKGGLVTDEHSRVLKEDGSVIEGLYATGNTSAAVMGNEYAGPGATIGPSLTFGWLAARHAMGQPFDAATAPLPVV